MTKDGNFSLEERFDIAYTTDCILNNNYKKIALQFPDELLNVAPSIVAQLKTSTRTEGIKRDIYILGDTSYGACCVDEVAAQHMNADFIVHYGRACMSRTTRLPVLYVFGKKRIDADHLVQVLCTDFSPETKLLVFFDVAYYYAIPALESALANAKRGNVVFARVQKETKKQVHVSGRIACATGSCSAGECNTDQTFDETTYSSDGNCNTCSTDDSEPHSSTQPTTQQTNTSLSPDKPTDTSTNTSANSPTPTLTSSTETTLNGRSFELLPGTSLDDYTFLYIGEEDATLTNLMMTNTKSTFFAYNPETTTLNKQSDVNKQLIRRYHYVEKARDADIIGIVVATLGVEGYMDVIEHIKKIIKESEKKSYLIVVGKLNEFKLGNFQEIDIFVIVACNENTIIDSKNYYKPVITPFELDIALARGKEWTGEFRTDFEHILKDADITAPPSDENTVRFSLNSQRLGKNPKHIDIELEETSTDLATRNNNVEMVTAAFATSYLASRSWRGLEQRIGETEVSAPVEGRSGIASMYEGEPGKTAPGTSN